MSDIFLSYSQKDKDRVRPIVLQLESQGWSVFWDQNIPPGKTFRQHIKENLDVARCVAVVWSNHSINSHWVCEEAEEGRSKNILVPLKIDQVDLPLGFKSIQAADLTNWNNDVSHEQFGLFVAAIASIVPKPQKEEIFSEPSLPQDVSQPGQLAQPEPLPETLTASLETSQSVSSLLQDASREDISDFFKPGLRFDEPSKKQGHIALWSALAIIMVALMTYFFIHPMLTNAGLPENFVLITGGQFTMGSPEDEEDRETDETQHEVKLSDFAICKYEVTVGEYLEFAREMNGTLPDGNDSGDRYPVVNVSWDDAKAYCDWLSKKRGGTYRLPTEAEWEYACRAGTTTPFNTGENLTTDQANYDGNYPYGKNAKGDYLEKTVPVDSLKPNGFGLYNMHGNVWEWCSDWYGSDYYEKCRQQGVVTDPENKENGSIRVLRGGSWDFYARYCRSAFRSRGRPGHRNNFVGFRLVFVPQFTSSQKPEEK